MASNNSSSTTTAATAGASGGTTKKGKMKGKTVDLTEFLNKPINWAEEMEELSMTPADPEHSGGYGVEEVRTEIMQKRSQLPTAPKAALSTSVDINRVPNTPPFSAYIGNISYDATDDDIVRFFHNLRVLNTRLMREGSRVKGFGYVEFETREDLIEALAMNKHRLLNREVKIDLADRPEEHTQRQGSYGSGRGGRQQRGGYDSEKTRDREQETSGDWRMGARTNAGPPSSYEDDRRSQPRTMASGRTGQQPGQGYGYPPPPPPHGYGPPQYGPMQGYGRRPPDDYGQQYQGRPGGYESDYAGGPGYGGGYEQYPMMRQASYSSQYSGYASDREGAGGGNYRRGGQPGSAGFYGSMRREHRGSDRRPPGQHMGGDRNHGGEGYPGPYPDYPPQQYYQQGGYGGGGGGPRDSFRQQRSRGGGYDNRRGPPRDSYGGYEQPYTGGGRRGPDERLSSVDTADGNDPAANPPKERPRLALQPRSLPPPAVQTEEPRADGHDGQQEQPAAAIRPRTSVSSAEVFGGARPVDTSAREREIEEKLRKEKEEFRQRQEEEARKQQAVQHRDNLRKSSSSNFVPERTGNAGRRRTSDSQSSTTGASHMKSPTEVPSRIEDEDQSNGQVKILQRAHTIGSENVTASEHADSGGQEQDYRRQPPSNRNKGHHPAQPPAQNYWASQNKRRNEEENEVPASEPAPAKSTEAGVDGVPEAGEKENEVPSNISERQRGGSQSKSSETEQESRRAHDEHEDDAVFKSHPRNAQHYGGQRGRGRGRGGGHHQYHYHQEQSTLPPRFARERDQQYARRGSSHTDDGQEHPDKRRPSKEIVIRRGGQGTLSPATGGGRRGGPAGGGPGRPPPQRTGSRERDNQQQRGNGRRQQHQQAEQRRGSADSGLPSSQQPDDTHAQKPPSGPPRRQQQPNAPGSRKSSATPSLPIAEPPPVTFESKNKFEMLNMDED